MRKNIGLAKETTLMFFVKVFGALFAFVLQVVLNRLFGTSVYGELSTYLSIGTVAVTLITFGTGTGMVRSAAVSETKNDDKRNLIFAYNVQFLVCIILLIFTVIFKKIILSLLGESTGILVLVFVYAVISSISAIYTGFLQGKKQTLVANLIDVVIHNLLLLVLAIVFSRVSKNIYSVLLAYITSSAVTTIYKIVHVQKTLSGSSINTKDHFLKKNTQFALLCVPFCLSTLCTSVQSMVMKVVLNSNMGSYDVGVFRILETYVACMALFVSPFITLWPYMAEAYKNNKTNELKRIYALSVSIIALLVLPTTISMLICGKEVYAIFSVNSIEVRGAFLSLFLMLIAGCFDAIIGPAGALLNMTKYGHVNFVITAGSTVVSILLSMMTIPKYGLVGAASSVALCKILTNIITAILNKVLLNIWPYEMKLGLLVAAAVPLYLVGFTIYKYLPDVLILRITVIASVEILGILLCFRLLYREESKRFINLILSKLRRQ